MMTEGAESIEPNIANDVPSGVGSAWEGLVQIRKVSSKFHADSKKATHAQRQ
jgi:hypothetical protein